MAIVIKSGNMAFLKKMGVPEDLISKLSAAGVKVSLGFKEFSLVGPGNVKLAEASLPISTNDLMKGSAPDSHVAQSKSILSAAAQQALTALGVKVSKAPLDSAVSNAIASVNELGQVTAETASAVEKFAHAAKSGNKFNIMSADEAKAKTPVLLRDATALYQRVRGTTEGSVYVVVAINKNVKIAARIKSSNSLSMRVEGDFTPVITAALEGQSFSAGQNYMSAHFNCSENVPASRVVGAVLMGSGMEFDTPLPSMNRVTELSQ